MNINTNFGDFGTSNIAEFKKYISENVNINDAECGNKCEIKTALSKLELQNEILENILKDMGFKVTDDNKALINMLMKDGKAVNKENLALLNRVVKLVGAENADKALFFLNNDIKPTINNGKNLVEIANHNFDISKETSILTKELNNTFEDKEIRNEIISKMLDLVENDSLLKNDGFEKEVLKIQNALKKEIETTDKTEIQNKATTETKNDTEEIQLKNNFDKAKISEPNNVFEKKEFIINNKSQLLNMLKDSIESGDIKTFAKEVEMFLKKGGVDLKSFGSEIIEELLKDNPKLKEKVISVFNTKDEYIKLINKKLNFDPKGKNGEELKEFIKEYEKSLEDIKDIAKELNPQKYENIIKTTEVITTKTQFMSELKDTTILQFPIVINNKEETAEIYVFNNKKGERKTKGRISAVISIDTGYIGHFEAYVIKEQSAVDCQFRVENDTKKLIIENIESLKENLNNYNLNLKSYRFKEITERFSIDQKEPEYEKSDDKIAKDFAFDKTT